jgi:hypothetical protein
MSCRFTLLALACLFGLSSIGCDKPGKPQAPQRAIPFAKFDKMVRGFGAVPFVITDVSPYKGCKVYLYHDQKAELVAETQLFTQSDELYLALPTSPGEGPVVFVTSWGYASSTTNTVKGSLNESYGWSEQIRKAKPEMSLLGTTFGPNLDPADFTDGMWCYVIKFE